MFAPIKSNIAGDANKKNTLQKNICLIILMHIACGNTVEINQN